MHPVRHLEPTTEVAGDASVISRSLTEPELFAVIFDRHAPAIHRYLSRRLGGQAADDLVSETFLAAFRARFRYDSTRGDARPWLYGIATKLIGTQRRQEARELRLRQAWPAAMPDAGHAERVTDAVTAHGIRPRLVRALTRLKPADRDVLLLVAWEELSYEQVAATLAIPVGTVRSRLNRARRKIRDTLGGANPTKTIEEDGRE